MKTENLMQAMEKHIADKINGYRHRLDVLKEVLEGADPKAILKKGYSVVTDERGNIVRDASMLMPEQMVMIEAACGFAEARITKTGKER